MELTRVTRRIGGFRRRIRSLYLLFGIATLVVSLGALLALSFLLDYLLDLPLAVRVVSFVVALLVLLVVAARSILYPLSVRLSDDDLALAAESRVPELKDRLISALQFRRQIEEPDNPESKEMMRAVIEEAGSLERAFAARRLTDSGRVLRRGLLAGAAVLLFAILLVAAPDTAGIWARRNLLLADLAWPRATTLVVLGFDANEEHVVTRGENVRVDVRAEGKVPDDVEIWFARLDDDQEDRRRMYQVEGERGIFRFEFRQVPSSFRFWVTGGDDTDGEPVYTVRARIPPTIEEIQARCVYPDYTGMEPETLPEGDLDLPEGTEVSLSLRFNMPVRSVSLAREEEEPVALATGADKRSAEAFFRADRTFDYSIRIVGEMGQVNPEDSARFRIHAVPDRRPQATILYPGVGQAYTPNGLVPVKLLATDNYGVSRLSLFLSRGRDGEYRERPFREEDLFPGPGPRDLLAYAAIPVADLALDAEVPIHVGDQIGYLAEAEDNNGNTDRTDAYRIEVVSEEDLSRKLSQKQAALREDAMDTRREQEQAVRETSGLLEFVEQGGELVRRDRERIRDVQILQGRVTRGMDRFFGALARVFNAYLYNRLANPKATEKILLIFDDFLRHDRENPSNVFKRDAYLRVIKGYREGRIFAPDDIIEVLLEIMEITIRISEETSPTAHRLLTGLARGGPEQGVEEDLKRIRDLMADILADFSLLDRKMQDWETWAELIETARLIRDTVERVRNGANEILKKPN